MKNIYILATLVLLTIFTACENQKSNNDLTPTSKENLALISMDKTNSYNNYNANIGNADFTIDNEDNSLHEGDDLLLTNKSVNSVSYHWDFGNGDTSTEAQPNYQYEIHGHYNVTLTVKDAFGKTSQSTNEILVLCVFGGGNHNQ